MEIKELILLMWRNARYLVLGVILGAALGFVVAQVETPVYQATTKVFVSRTRQQSNADMLSLSDEQLLAINLQLAKSQPILDEVSSQLGAKINADNIQVESIPNTLIVQIRVQDQDPQRAATIANSIVAALVKQNNTLLSGRYTAFETAINEQVDEVQKQIDSLQTQVSEINQTGIQEQLTQVNQQIEQLKTQISALEREIASSPDFLTPLERATLAEKQSQLNQLNSLMTLYQQVQTNLTYVGKPGQGGLGMENPRLTVIQSTLDLYQQMHLTLINSRENVRLARIQNQQNVMPIVAATVPKKPLHPLPALYGLLGAIVGLALSATTILVINNFDDTLRTIGQIEKALGISVVGTVSDGHHTSGGLIALDMPYSKKTEAFRTLGASLEIIGAGKSVRTIMIANARPADAKNTIAANLAVVNAQQGRRVTLLDGDLGSPHLHSFFGAENEKGFAEFLHDGLNIKSVCHAVEKVEGLTLIPGGVAEKDSTSWMDAEKLWQLLTELRKQSDLVIVDSPSADLADAQILAAEMDEVLLVIRAGHTRLEAAQATMRRFQLIGAKVVGAVLIQKTRRQGAKLQPLSWIKTKSGKKEDAYEVQSETENLSVSPSN